MERLTEHSKEDFDNIIYSGNDEIAIVKKLAKYEDTGLTPEEIKTLKEQLDISRAEVQRLSKKLAECQKSDADKERYTIELYSRARKAEEKADYWEREAKKWCAKLGEIRIWIGAQN
jgi:DNA-binding transcriptional MerR regulator